MARKQDLEVPELDAPRQVPPGPGVDDSGPRDDDDAPSRLPDLFHLVGDRADENLLGFLCRDLARHECEDLGLPRSLQRRDPHALVADDDLDAGRCALKNDASRAPGLGVDSDRAIHLDVFDHRPAVADQHFGREVAGRVETLREHALLGDLRQLGRLFRFRRRAQRPSLAHDAVELLGRRRHHLHATDRGIGLVLSDLQLLDREIPALVHDQVHDLGQDHRVDDVTLEDQAGRVPLAAHRSAPTTALMAFLAFAASTDGFSAYRTLRLAETRHEAGSPFHAARTEPSRSPPCAPMPGMRNGSWDETRTSAISVGAVAPTTRPTLP